MKKIIRLGKVKVCNRKVNLFCSIKYNNGRLSISGVEGPKRNGDAYGSCGQVKMHIDNDYIDNMEFAPGWNRELFEKFLEIWRKWHLNDMHPECEHQRKLGWGKKDVELVTYRLTNKAMCNRNVIRNMIFTELEKKGKVTLAKNEQKIFNLKFEITLPIEQELPKLVKPYYREYKREKKNTGWLRPDEHPEGVLGKPCPVCGYKYGTEWKTVEVPKEVIKFLENLPDTDVEPAWI